MKNDNFVRENLNKKETEHLMFFESIFDVYIENFPDLDFSIGYVPLYHFIHFIT